MGIVTLQHDSELGRWTQCLWSPPELAPWVEQLWYSEGLLTNLRERVLPSGTLEMVVNLGDTIRLVEGKGVEILAGGCVSGVLTTPAVIEQPRHHRAVGVRLRPAGAHAILARPTSEVSDLFVSLDDLIGPAARELAERCHGARTPADCLRAAALWVAERARGSPGLDPAIAFVAREIERTAGEVSIAALRDRTGMTKTRLAERFREQMGLTPKRYARVVRFRRAVSLIDAGARSLADVAAAAGYYDQPHMNADFRALSGMSPRDLIASRYPGGVTAVDPPE